MKVSNRRVSSLLSLRCFASLRLCVTGLFRAAQFTQSRKARKEESQSKTLLGIQASVNAASLVNCGRLRPPIHLRMESAITITAAVMMSAVREVLM